MSTQYKVTFLYNDIGHTTYFDSTCRIRDLVEKFETYTNLRLENFYMAHNKRNIMSANRLALLKHYFGEEELDLKIYIIPKKYVEQSILTDFEARFSQAKFPLGKAVKPEYKPRDLKQRLDDEINARPVQPGDDKFEKDLEEIMSSKKAVNDDPNVCQHDKQNPATQICTKCKAVYCNYCTKFDVHKKTVPFREVDAVINSRYTALSAETSEQILDSEYFSELMNIDYCINDKVSVIEKQFNNIRATIDMIEKTQKEYLIDYFYSRVESRTFKAVPEEVKKYNQKLKELPNTAKMSSMLDKLAALDVVEEKFADIKEVFTEFKNRFSSYDALFSSFEEFNEQFSNQIAAKLEQSKQIKDTSKREKLKPKQDQTDKTSSLLKMKYYNSVLVWNHAERRIHKVTDFVDRHQFKLNYQTYSGNVCLNHQNRLFIVTGGKFDMFYFFDLASNEVFRLPNLVHSHCRGGLFYVSRLNAIFCLGAKISNKCEAFRLKNFNPPKLKDLKKEDLLPEQSMAETVDYLKSGLLWEELPDLKFERYYSGGFEFNKYFYVFFGMGSNLQELGVVERLDLDQAKEWEVVKFDNPRYINVKMHSMACIKANEEEVYILGGDDGKDYLDRVVKYNFIREAIYSTEIKVPELSKHEYFRFWEESQFKDMFNYSAENTESNDYVYAAFDAKDKVHLFNIKNMRYEIKEK